MISFDVATCKSLSRYRRQLSNSPKTAPPAAKTQSASPRRIVGNWQFYRVRQTTVNAIESVCVGIFLREFAAQMDG
jgi:hypothetical protein